MRRVVLFVVLAVVAAPMAAAQGTAPHSVDLATGEIDGHQVLGRTVAGVTTALGRPDFRSGPSSRYRVGWGTPARFSTEVIFRRSGGIQHAWSIVFERGQVRDAKVGDLLQPSPALQRAILAKYRATYKLVRPYACTTDASCIGEFSARSGPLHLTFGTRPLTGTWLTIWK